MRASFLISRKQPWMGQLLLMARNKALTLLLKLYRRTPIFRPRHLPGRNRTQSGGLIRDRTILPSAKNTNLSCRFSQLTMFGGLVHLDVLREDDFLNEDSDVELEADGEILLDMHSRRRQGNFELALMAGGQLDVDSEEDEEYDEWDCEGCVRYVKYGECEGGSDLVLERIGQNLEHLADAYKSFHKVFPQCEATSPSKP
ncbi:uncharacterized protein LOC6535188 [Drosophila yakuba]|uniref:Uncharacterized protein n=1 Tax=Drosophila yakuba TaxID=7245 RepID=B4PIQ4_DROYA|nr:uncharacterized protein LOC6535188 [Drosophila yakuba]EDW95562.1 uncharacterized protein Dyak_GE22639 [Drosophila yakuba]